MFFMQLIFIIRDNYASRLATGAVTALTYGYMFQQLPETLIGTAIGTAILPSLSVYLSDRDFQAYREVIQKACRIALAMSLGAAVIMSAGLGPAMGSLFGFAGEQNLLMMNTLRCFLIGLAGHCLLEIANRAYYAQEQAVIPLLGTILNVLIYIAAGFLLFRKLGAPGLSLTDSIAYTSQAILLLVILAHPQNGNRLFSNRPFLNAPVDLRGTLLRCIPGAAAAGVICFGLMSIPNGNILVKSMLGMCFALLFYCIIISPELKLLKRF